MNETLRCWEMDGLPEKRWGGVEGVVKKLLIWQLEAAFLFLRRVRREQSLQNRYSQQHLSEGCEGFPHSLSEAVNTSESGTSCITLPQLYQTTSLKIDDLNLFRNVNGPSEDHSHLPLTQPILLLQEHWEKWSVFHFFTNTSYHDHPKPLFTQIKEMF